jgi:hypothetical protein
MSTVQMPTSQFEATEFVLLKVDLPELLDPLNARGGPVKLYRPTISYISICWGLVDPI